MHGTGVKISQSLVHRKQCVSSIIKNDHSIQFSGIQSRVTYTLKEKCEDVLRRYFRKKNNKFEKQLSVPSQLSVVCLYVWLRVTTPFPLRTFPWYFISRNLLKSLCQNNLIEIGRSNIRFTWRTTYIYASAMPFTGYTQGRQCVASSK